MLHDRQPSRPNESLTWPQLLKGEAISTLTVGMVGLIVMLAINEYRTATAFLVLDMLAAGAYLVGRQFDKTSPPLPLTEKAPTIIIVGPFHDLTVTEYAASSSIPKHGDIAVMVSKIPTDPTLN